MLYTYAGYIFDEDEENLIKNVRRVFFPLLYEGFGYPPFYGYLLNISCITSDTSSMGCEISLSVRLIPATMWIWHADSYIDSMLYACPIEFGCAFMNKWP
jgi:hypothetical protein